MKTTTQTEKINRIFEILKIWLQVKEDKRQKEVIKEYSVWSNIIHKHTEVYITNSYNLINAKNCISPFSDIKIQFNDQIVEIVGNNFKYQIACDQILTMQKRFQKIKELKVN